MTLSRAVLTLLLPLAIAHPAQAATKRPSLERFKQLVAASSTVDPKTRTTVIDAGKLRTAWPRSA